jgi:hypothetical protein
MEIARYTSTWRRVPLPAEVCVEMSAVNRGVPEHLLRQLQVSRLPEPPGG